MTKTINFNENNMYRPKVSVVIFALYCFYFCLRYFCSVDTVRYLMLYPNISTFIIDALPVSYLYESDERVTVPALCNLTKSEIEITGKTR
jgi:hypothetical protein